MNSIIVQCHREFTDHVRLTFDFDFLKIEYGNGVPEHFQPIHKEYLEWQDYPDLLEALHDGAKWNMDEVFCLVQSAETADIGTPMHIHLLQADGHWLEEVIRHSRAG